MSAHRHAPAGYSPRPLNGSRSRALPLFLCLLSSSAALSAEPSPGASAIQASRAPAPIVVDGALDEAAWAGAVPFTGFLQLFPIEGAAPSERTEVRVLYDDRNLYVGFINHDSMPGEINRALGRRDSVPASDTVEVAIDSANDRRTALSFGVNAGGVLFDSLVYDDSTVSQDWDAVWDASVRELSDGWSAEFVIPLHILRFSPAQSQSWGFMARRNLARTHEQISSVLIPRSSTGRVSRFGNLSGLEGLSPRTNVELTPYVAARAAFEPQFSDPTVPQPRLLNPALDVGLDLKAALTSDLLLNVTINPDFGQVEADQLLLNLSNAEQFFPEKRPFFTQGMDLFLPVSASVGLSAQQLFYSRRIGLQTPIIAAANLTGAVSQTVNVGVLDAVVNGAAVPDMDEADPDRNWRFHLERPLHLGPTNALPRDPQVPQNYLWAVSRWRPNEEMAVGARVGLATPLTGTCSASDAESDLPPASCLARGGNSAAVDWNLRSPGSEWVLIGQLIGSQTVGGLPEVTLRDGTVLRRGDTGLGAYVAGGKLGGEPFRFDVGYRYSSPSLELNAAGFQSSANEHSTAASVHFTRPQGFGPFQAFDSFVSGNAMWSADGRWVGRSRRVALGFYSTLTSFHLWDVEAGYLDPHFDIREIPGTGIAVQRVPFAYVGTRFESDPNQRLSAYVDGSLKYYLWPDSAHGTLGWLAEAGLTLRPQDRFETKLVLGSEQTPDGPRFVDQVGDRYLFAPLSASGLSLTLRQQWVITPRLTLQGYAQLFRAVGRYGTFLEGSAAPGGTLRFSDLSPAEYTGASGFHDTALNLNAVLRWEYRLGSTLFLVYSRSQAGLPLADGEPLPRTLLPTGLGRGPQVDAFMMKWSYMWGG